MWFPFFKVVELGGPVKVIISMLAMNIAFSLILVIIGYSDYRVMKIQQREVNQTGVIMDGR